MIKRKEMIVIMFLVLIALILLGARFFMSGDQNDKALRVTQNDRVIMTIPLHKDTEEKIVDGDHYNIIVIKEGKAFVQEANCKNQICVHTGEKYKPKVWGFRKNFVTLHPLCAKIVFTTLIFNSK